jgi:DNA end-binding protein Ku
MLRYADELRPESGLDLPAGDAKKAGVTAREIDLAEKLINGMVEKWNPKKYKDDYREDVLALIEKKIKKGEINSISNKKAPAHAKPESKNVLDLMELLKKSLGGKPGTKKAADKPTSHSHAHRIRTKKSA